MLTAITRAVSRSIARCELTHVARQPIDLARAQAQHAEYEAALERAGCRVVQLDELPDHPDAVFVEDVAVVLDEVAILTRPGAPSRLGEVAAIEGALANFRPPPILHLSPPGTLDGGDVLRLGRTLYVGITPRSSRQGIAELAALVAPYGYSVSPVPVQGALHLKTAVTQIAPSAVLYNPAWVEASWFTGHEAIAIDPSEPFAANAVLANEHVIHSTAYPRTHELLRRRGLAVIGVDASELAKAEGGVTCCSLIFQDLLS